MKLAPLFRDNAGSGAFSIFGCRILGESCANVDMSNIKMGAIGPDDDDDGPSIGSDHNDIDHAVEKVSPAIAEAETEVSKSLPNRRVSTFTDTFRSENKLKFLIENVLPDHGIVFFGGISGTGKTILAIQVLVNLVMGRPTMSWYPVEDLPPIKGMMLSLEMSGPEWQRRAHDMYPDLTPEEEKILGERFLLYSEPEPFKLWRDDHCADLIRLIMMNEVDVVLIDSASVSFAESLKDNEAQINKSLENLDTIRVRMQVCFIIVAHTRKPPSGESTSVENISINELFGHSGIAQHASSIFLLYEDEKHRRQTIKDGNGDSTEKVVHIVNVKTRFGSSNHAFKAMLPSLEMTRKGSPLQFYRKVAGAIAMTHEQRKKIKSDGTTLAEEMKKIDFSAFLDDEDDL